MAVPQAAQPPYVAPLGAEDSASDRSVPVPARFDNVNLLRAFAALAVVVYHVIEHTHWTAFPAAGPLTVFRIGWIGVDLFFVISGFVITYSGLILHRRSAERFAKDYWQRRLTRILPLYLVTLVAWLVMDWPGIFAGSTRGWLWQLASHLTFTHNFWAHTHGSIDGVNWTLAIEMQFYLAVALLIGWIGRTPGWRIWLYGIAISWAWRACMLVLYADGTADGGKLFVHAMSFPGVLDEFGAGIFLAKMVLDGRERARLSMRSVAWLAGAAAVGYGVMSIFWRYGSYWNFPAMVVFWRSGFAVVLLCVVALAVELPQVIAHRWLRPFNYLGEVSYGIYLWHLFAVQLVIYHLGLRHGAALVAVVPVTIGLAALSWHLLEKPVMGLARRK